MEDITEIKVSDLKTPKKAISKAVKVILLGVGGGIEPQVREALLKVIPTTKPIITNSIVTLAFGLANGFVKNEYASNVLSGMFASASGNLAKNVIDYVKGMVPKEVKQYIPKVDLANAVNEYEDYM